MEKSCNILSAVAEAQRNALTNINVYNGSRNYTSTDVNATVAAGLADDPQNIRGKGTGRYLDTTNGGSSVDKHGIPSLGALGRDGIYVENFYTPNLVYDCR
jgi:hypothetical protein